MLERVGNHVVGERAFFIVEVDHPDQLGGFTGLPSEHFCCLLVWDADTADDATIATAADALIRAGAVYVCTWGRDCERVHDVVDSVLLGPVIVADQSDRSSVMTTWHSGDSLADATWFAMFFAHPDEEYAATCKAVLAVTVRARTQAEEIRRAFLDPERFNAAHS